MKLITGLLIIVAFRLSIFQASAQVLSIDDCSNGIERANNDFKSGILSISHWGLSIDFEYDKFFDNYMVTKFGIESTHEGCVVFMSQKCYDQQMRKFIKDRFGADYLSRAEKEIISEYEVFKTLNNEQRKKYINFDFTYKIVDRKAVFKEGREVLIKELHDRVDFSKINPLSMVVGLSVIIGESGSVDKCEIISKDFPIAEAEKIKEVIKELGNWTPATLYGFNVKSELILGVPLK